MKKIVYLLTSFILLATCTTNAMNLSYQFSLDEFRFETVSGDSAITTLISHPENITPELVERDGTKKAAKRTSESDDYSPLVVEGRAWWYSSLASTPCGRYDFGLQIYGSEIIDGTEWYNLNIVRMATDMYGGLQYYIDNYLIYHLREENKKIYGCNGWSHDIDYKYDGLHFYKFDPWSGYSSEHCPDNGYLLMTFGEKGEECSYLGADSDYGYTIADIRNEDINGFTHKIYQPTWNEASLKELDPGWENYVYAERIGWLDRYFYFPFSHVYFAANPHYTPPILEYVTDPDGSIIYNRADAPKLWDYMEYKEALSIRAVSAETESAVEWYNLQGLRVESPQPGGVYIRKDARGTQKVMMK